jgi:pSer/pThr/pTyr-binding forkhead associated (FHA) protein
MKIRSPDNAEQEIELSGIVSIGRAKDNSICIDDSSVSRYHAVIEERQDGFWLSDLGSINGTSINGASATAERRLVDGDRISIGEVGGIEFHTNGTRPISPQISPEPSLPVNVSPSLELAGSSPVLQQSTASASAGASPKLIIAAVAVGLAVTAVLVILFIRSRQDHATVRIISPQSGTTVRGSLPIHIEASKTRGIDRVIFQLDGVEFESAEIPPFSATLDPVQLKKKSPNLADGNHILSITIEDKEGNKRLQSDTVLLAFETGSKVPTNTGGGDVGTGSVGDNSGRSSSGVVDIASLARNLASQITQKSGYLFDREFTEQIRLQTDKYRVNVMDDARKYRREIIKGFRDKGLHPLLGFVLAMSQSRFREDGSLNSTQGNVGIWQIPPQIARNYLAPGESEAAFKDPMRSAEIAAAYMKDLINIFGMDGFMYAIACYGTPLNQVGQIRTRLEQISPGLTDQGNWGVMVKSGEVPREGADRVARFFAAGVVGENPGLFGLQSERLSSLY